MKYKFVNRDTKEEIPHIWIDGFVYLYKHGRVSKEDGYCYDEYSKSIITSNQNLNAGINDSDYFRKIIFTNNPLLTDVPQIQLEENITWTDEDLIEFFEWCWINIKEYMRGENYFLQPEFFIDSDIDTDVPRTKKELLELWKEQRIKIIEV